MHQKMVLKICARQYPSHRKESDNLDQIESLCGHVSFWRLFDDEFEEHSIALLYSFENGEKILIASDLMLQELEDAPQKVIEKYHSLPTEFIEFVTLDEEARFLAKKYIDERAISEKFLVDAQHIAIASINRVDVLVSWNFRHIVNLRRIQLYNATNLKYGYPLIEIRSPREIIQ